jgi:hypothetical protein
MENAAVGVLYVQARMLLLCITSITIPTHNERREALWNQDLGGDDSGEFHRFDGQRKCHGVDQISLIN